jgi:hypothetical protein
MCHLFYRFLGANRHETCLKPTVMGRNPEGDVVVAIDKAQYSKVCCYVCLLLSIPILLLLVSVVGARFISYV